MSMAPLSREVRPICSLAPPHLGPAVPEVNSLWFKLFLYHMTGYGPPTLFLIKGTKTVEIKFPSEKDNYLFLCVLMMYNIMMMETERRIVWMWKVLVRVLRIKLIMFSTDVCTKERVTYLHIYPTRKRRKLINHNYSLLTLLFYHCLPYCILCIFNLRVFSNDWLIILQCFYPQISLIFSAASMGSMSFATIPKIFNNWNCKNI